MKEKIRNKINIFFHNIRSLYRKYWKKTTLKYRVRYLLILIGISTAFFGGVICIFKSFGMYESASNLTLDVETAFFCIEEGDYVYNMNLDGLVPDDQEYSYVFTIANYKENNISNVDMEYSIELSTTTNIPLTYKLYKGDAIMPSTNSQKQDRDGAWYNVIESTGKYILNHSVATTDTYRLTVKFPSIYNVNETYAGLIESVQIVVKSRQIIGSDYNE